MERNCSNKDEEQKIISGFLSGDPKAARMFFEKYGGIIMHAAGKADIKSNMMDREDLFQDAITYILKDNMKIVRDFKGHCKFSTYLYLVCRRYAIKKTRKKAICSLEKVPRLCMRNFLPRLLTRQRFGMKIRSWPFEMQ